VGKVAFFKVGNVEYKLKSPPAKVIPKLLSLQGKETKDFTEADWDKVISVLTEAVKRTYPEWSQEEVDDFVVNNMPILQENLVVAMGWMSEEDLEKAKKNPNPQ
jgi:hypothetical protein